MMKGTCLCGAVSFEIEGALEHAPDACHCSQCRKQTGHFLVSVNVRRKALTVHGADKVTWYRSSKQVRRGFCSVCGSSLFWDPTIVPDPQAQPEWFEIAAGLLDDDPGVRPGKHIYVDFKAAWFDIDGHLPLFDKQAILQHRADAGQRAAGFDRGVTRTKEDI